MDNNTDNADNTGTEVDGSAGRGDTADADPVASAGDSRGVDAANGESDAMRRIVHCSDMDGHESNTVVALNENGLVLDAPRRAVFTRLDDIQDLSEAITKVHLVLISRHANNDNPHRTHRRPSTGQPGDESSPGQGRACG